jgi:hypothetical protein
MRRDRKSYSTINDVKPCSTRHWILLSMGSCVLCSLGTFSYQERLLIESPVDTASWLWTSVYAIT